MTEEARNRLWGIFGGFAGLAIAVHATSIQGMRADFWVSFYLMLTIVWFLVGLTRFWTESFGVALVDCLAKFESMAEIKGEITLLIEGAAISEIDVPDDLIRSRLRTLIDNKQTRLSDAVRQVSIELGVKKKRAYRLALSLKR